MKKRLISTLLAMAICSSMGLSAFAAESGDIKQSDEGLSVAYMDLDSASETEKVKIIAAREEIICNESWVADNVNGRIIGRDGKVKEELPHFSEIFPSDWEQPNFGAVNDEVESDVVVESAKGKTDEVFFLFSGDVALKKPSTTVNSKAFCSFDTVGFMPAGYPFEIETVFTQGTHNFPSDTGTYNVGYSNNTTGESLGLATRLENGETFSIDPPTGVKVAVRASTYDRRIYFVFWNYWYYAERDKNFKIQCCKFRESHRNAVFEGARIIQEKKKNPTQNFG